MKTLIISGVFTITKKDKKYSSFTSQFDEISYKVSMFGQTKEEPTCIYIKDLITYPTIFLIYFTHI